MANQREELANRINLAIAGENFEAGYCALMDVLAALTIYLAADKANYDQLIEKVGDDLKRYGHKHWDFFKAQEAVVSSGRRGRA